MSPPDTITTTAALALVGTLLAACGTNPTQSQTGQPRILNASSRCPSAYPEGPNAIASSMRGSTATMVPLGAVWVRECRYGMKINGAGLVSQEPLNQSTIARWVADFNATHPDRPAPPGVSVLCGSDNFDRRLIYFGYANGPVRAVLATTNGCLRLSNGVRYTLLTRAVEADLGLLLL